MATVKTKPHGLAGRPSNRWSGHERGSAVTTRTFSVTLPEALVEALDAAAAEQGIARNKLVRQILEGASAPAFMR